MAKDRAAEARKRFREGRRQAAEAIRDARRSGAVAGFEPLVSSDACKVCLAVRSHFIPLRGCKPSMLPPFDGCDFPDGCESTYVEVLKEERRIRARASRRPGCLKRIVTWLIIFVGASVIWGMIRHWMAGR